MRQLFGLVIFTKKEVMQLLVEEKRTSYRKGYKAGAALRYRHVEKSETATWPNHGIPSVYGDSLPITENSAETLTSEK